LERSLGNVVLEDIVGVFDRGSVDVKSTGLSEASFGIGYRVGTDLAVDIILLAIRGLVLYSEDRSSSDSVLKCLSSDLIAVSTDAHNRSSLRHRERQRSGQSYLGS